MPIHFNDIDIISEIAGLSSALIVPCYMCPAVIVAVRENKSTSHLKTVKQFPYTGSSNKTPRGYDTTAVFVLRNCSY